MELRELSFQIEGVTALMTDSPAKMVLAAQSKKSYIPAPEEEAEGGVYRTPEGYCGIPATAIRKAIITVAASHRVKGRGARSLKGFVTHIQIVPEDLLVLCDKNWNPLTEYEVDVRRCVNKSTRGAVLRGRPLFREWRTSFTLLIEEEVIPVQDAFELFSTLLSEAGSRIGIGSYRPECGGWFGRFQLASEEASKPSKKKKK